MRLEDPGADAEWQAERVRAREEAWPRVVGRRFAAARLEDLAEPEAIPEFEGWLLPADQPNLVILGPVGVGKSWAAAAVARRCWEAGRSVVVRTGAEMLDALRPGGRADEWHQVTTADVLVLDDLGLERSTDWTDERLYMVVNRRWVDMAPIVATSNLTPSGLKQAVGERTYSRLVGSGAAVVTLRGRDRRASS